MGLSRADYSVGRGTGSRRMGISPNLPFVFSMHHNPNVMSGVLRTPDGWVCRASALPKAWVQGQSPRKTLSYRVQRTR
jgi:hypothetical protein